MTRLSHSLFRFAGLAVLVFAGTLGAAMAESEHPAFACRDPQGTTLLRPTAPRTRHEACVPVSLPVPLDQVRWAQLLPHPVPEEASLTVSGRRAQGGFEPVTVRVASAEPPPREALPIGSNVLSALRPAPFGAEERATAAFDEGRLSIRCEAGTQPAGVILESGQSLPRGARYGLEIEAEAEGEGFTIGLTGREGTPRRFLPLRTGAPVLIAPEPAAVERPWFVVVCPAAGATLSLRRIELLPMPTSPAHGIRSAWAWEPRLWRENAETLLAKARQARVKRLFISAEVAGDTVRDADALARFVARARKLAIDVVVVEGDPAMALDEGRPGALRRLAALVAYQRQAPASSRLAGVQYDIEPYILPAYAADPASVLARWARTIDALGAAAGPLKLDIVLPFWLPHSAQAAEVVLPAVARSAASVTVMAYRTTPEAIQGAAEPLLNWGHLVSKPIRVAIEMGLVHDEITRAYAPAPEGDVLVLPAGDGSLVVALRDSYRPLTGRAYRFGTESVAGAGLVSFLGDRGRLEAAANHLETVLGAWSSFDGLAFHGLIP